MYVRTAFFEGQLTQEQLTAFKEAMTHRIAPLIKTFPGVLRLELFWVDETDPGAPQTVLMMQHSYENREALMTSLASDERNSSMPITMALIEEMGLSVYHVNHHLDQHR